MQRVSLSMSVVIFRDRFMVIHFSRIGLLLLAGLTLLLFSWVCSAQGAEPLTLEDGIRILLKNNPTLHAAEHSLEAAEQGVLEARGRFFPRIDLSESFTRTNGPGEVFWTQLSQERFSLTEFAATNPNDPDPIGNYNTRLTLTQPIYSGGRIRTGYQISRLQRDAVRNGRERIRQTVIRNFTTAFYRVLLADRFIHVADLARAAVQAHLKMARDLLDQGMVLRSDLLRVKVHLSEVEARQITAAKQKRLATANLNRIMGVDQGTSFQLVEREEKNPPPGDLKKLIREAREKRPDLRRLSLLEESAEKGVRMARSSFLPNLNLVARYDKNDRDFLGSDGEYWTVMAVAGINLFEGGSGKARALKAVAEKDRISSFLARAVQGVELEVRKAFLERQEAEARLKVAREMVSEAEESLRMIEDRYRSGMAHVTELLDTETALSEARTRLAKALYDVEVSRTDLDLAVGRL